MNNNFANIPKPTILDYTWRFVKANLVYCILLLAIVSAVQLTFTAINNLLFGDDLNQQVAASLAHMQAGSEVLATSGASEAANVSGSAGAVGASGANNPDLNSIIPDVSTLAESFSLGKMIMKSTLLIISFCVMCLIVIFLNFLLNAIRDARGQASIFRVNDFQVNLTVGDSWEVIKPILLEAKTGKAVIRTFWYLFAQLVIMTLVLGLISEVIAPLGIPALNALVILVSVVLVYSWIMLSVPVMLMTNDSFGGYINRIKDIYMKFGGAVFNYVIFGLFLLIVMVCISVVFVSIHPVLIVFFSLVTSVAVYFMNIYAVFLVRYYLEYINTEVKWVFGPGIVKPEDEYLPLSDQD